MPPALDDWDTTITALLALGEERETVVVLDEYPYLLEHTPQLDSIIRGVRAAQSDPHVQSCARDPNAARRRP